MSTDLDEIWQKSVAAWNTLVDSISPRSLHRRQAKRWGLIVLFVRVLLAQDVTNGWSTSGDILRHPSTLISVWPCCTPGRWSASSASDGGYIRSQKANGQLEKTTGPP